MPRKYKKTDKLLENQVQYRLNGKIDLAKLWKLDEDKELDPQKVKQIQNERTKS